MPWSEVTSLSCSDEQHALLDPNEMKEALIHLLLGSDLRSTGRSDALVRIIQDQESFDTLFNLLFHHERMVVMRAADAVEKITVHREEFLAPHKDQILKLINSTLNKELKWHVALLVSRLCLTDGELNEVQGILTYWAQNPNESKIVRVNALQGLFGLSHQFPRLKPHLEQTLNKVEHEPIPSLKARIKKLRKVMH